MTLTGPQKIPFASQAYFYGNTYQGSAMESNVVVLHTTEGTSLPSYDGGAVAPNVTGVPDFANKRIKWYQHYDVDRSSRALVNASGGVETNTANAFQIELTGTCDPARRVSWGSAKAGEDYLYWPDAPDWALKGVGDLLAWLNANHGVKLQSTVTFKAYPDSYGASNGVRLSGAQWGAYYGVLGHMHAPENFHGDPGNINIQRILAFAKGEAEQENDVALTDAEIEKIARQTVTGDSGMHDPSDATKVWALSSYVGLIYKTAKETAAQVAEVEAKVDAITVGGVDLSELAVKVADELYRRMQS